jgi:hypothetical protein
VPWEYWIDSNCIAADVAVAVVIAEADIVPEIEVAGEEEEEAVADDTVDPFFGYLLLVREDTHYADPESQW